MTRDEQLLSMQEKLRETISMSNYIEGKFQVFAWEASVGKSKFTTEFIAEQVNNSILDKSVKPLKYLVVKKFAAEVVEMEEKLNQLFVGKHIALAVGLTHENINALSGIPNLLKDAYVLIITHSRYIELCKAPLQEPFGNRDVLIIDEKIQFPNYTYSKSKYDNVRRELPYSLQAEFDEWHADLLIRLEKLDEHATNKLKVFSVAKNMSKLKVFMEKLKPYKLSKEMADFLSELEHFYNAEVLYNNSNLFVMNKRYKMRMLKNNIILDASAVVEPMYDGSKFVIVEDSKVIDYSKSNLIYELRNTSTTNWLKDSKMLNRLEEFLPYLLKEGRKTLVVSHKDHSSAIKKMLLKDKDERIKLHIPKIQDDKEVSTIEDCNIALNWYGNIVGQNQYSNFNTCLLVGTFNLPYPIYLLQYALYNDVESFKGWNLEIKKGKFEDESLEKVRKGAIAADFYQALKRVQRNLSPNAMIIVFNHDEEIADELFSQLPNINFNMVKKSNLDKAEKCTQSSLLKDWLLTQNQGKYRKSKVREVLNLNSSNFNRLIDSEEIQELINEGKIKVNHHFVVVE